MELMVLGIFPNRMAIQVMLLQIQIGGIQSPIQETMLALRNIQPIMLLNIWVIGIFPNKTVTQITFQQIRLGGV